MKVVCNALCHTDVYTLSGQDPEGLFPSILGHEAGAIVEAIGEGVTSVAVGDTVVPGYTPQCKGPSCIFCMSPKTNLCPKIRGTQGQGFMPDGTSRFTLEDGESDPPPRAHAPPRDASAVGQARWSSTSWAAPPSLSTPSSPRYHAPRHPP